MNSNTLHPNSTSYLLSIALTALSLLLGGCLQTPNHQETGILSLGGFQLQIEGNQLLINATTEPGHIMWTSIDTGRLLSAHKTTLNITDQRSSYKINERSQQNCLVPEIQTFEQTANNLVFSGPFLDCTDLHFQLTFALVDKQLQFTLTTDNTEYNHLGLHYQSQADEHFYGFGEQYSYTDLKGLDIPILTQEQGIGRGNPIISMLLNLFSPGSSGHKLTSYYSVPQYITNQRHSLFLENKQYTRFNLEDKDSVSVNAFSSEMVGRILYGETLLDLIEEFTVFTGRMKALPDWMNQGAILGVQGGTEQVKQVWQQLKSVDTPIAAFWLQDWVGKRVTLGGAGSQLWWNWELDEDRYPDWDGLISDFDDEDIRVMGYINPFLVDVTEKGNANNNFYAEALLKGYLIKDKQGLPYPITITDFDAGLVDLSNPDARSWLKTIIQQQMINNGFSGWMADFGESLPYDAVFFSDESGLDLHNKYPEEWAKLNAEAIAEVGMSDEIVFFNRSGFTQSPSYSSLFWLGDQMVMWDHYDGLTSSIIGLMNGGFSGISLNHSDIGGYTSFAFNGLGLNRSKELLLRWIEMNAFTAVFRSHEGLSPQGSAQVYSDDETLNHFSTFAKIYQSLADYRSNLFVEAEEKGYPVVRHPLLHFPHDKTFATMKTSEVQFMLGADFMIAPALKLNQRERIVHLPAGNWIHLWTGTVIDAPAAGISFKQSMPLGQPPVYYRASSADALLIVSNLKNQGIVKY
ncbi:MAG: alpha-glucosidase [Moraxellaceae bacterium]|nr:MAG: alpha-glucosidase [Moraxellaceae bacterium]